MTDTTHNLTDIFTPIPKVKRLVVCEPGTDNWSIDTIIWLRSFQGIINRDEPHLYIAPAAGKIHEGGAKNVTDHWLNYYRGKYDPQSAMRAAESRHRVKWCDRKRRVFVMRVMLQLPT